MHVIVSRRPGSNNFGYKEYRQNLTLVVMNLWNTAKNVTALAKKQGRSQDSAISAIDGVHMEGLGVKKLQLFTYIYIPIKNDSRWKLSQALKGK